MGSEFTPGRPDSLLLSHLRGSGIPIMDEFGFPSEIFHYYVLAAVPYSMKI